MVLLSTPVVRAERSNFLVLGIGRMPLDLQSFLSSGTVFLSREVVCIVSLCYFVMNNYVEIRCLSVQDCVVCHMMFGSLELSLVWQVRSQRS